MVFQVLTGNTASHSFLEAGVPTAARQHQGAAVQTRRLRLTCIALPLALQNVTRTAARFQRMSYFDICTVLLRNFHVLDRLAVFDRSLVQI